MRHYENNTYKYTYDKVVYVKSKDKVIITCKKHGDFEQPLSDHLQGKGCSKCSNRYIPNTKEWIEKAKEIHSGRYGYGKVNYVRAPNNVVITCMTHGDFVQKASVHLRGFGCSRCSKQYAPTTEEWIEKAYKLHKGKYTYSKTVYLLALEKIVITCPKHGDFLQKPSEHLMGHGCQQCALEKSAYQTYKDRPTTLYYVKFTHPDTQVEAWKIGLTLKTPQSRFYVEIANGYKVDIIATKLFEDGYQAYKLEQYILKLFTQHRPYDNIGNPYLPREGNTEVFDRDVLDSLLLSKYCQLIQ